MSHLEKRHYHLFGQRRPSSECAFAKSDLAPRFIKLFSCSTQLSMKFSLLINMKMPTQLAFSYSLAEKFSCSDMFSKKEFGIVSNLRFFMLSWVEHEKSVITSGPEYSVLISPHECAERSGPSLLAFGITARFRANQYLIFASRLHIPQK